MSNSHPNPEAGYDSENEQPGQQQPEPPVSFLPGNPIFWRILGAVIVVGSIYGGKVGFDSLRELDFSPNEDVPSEQITQMGLLAYATVFFGCLSLIILGYYFLRTPNKPTNATQSSPDFYLSERKRYSQYSKKYSRNISCCLFLFKPKPNYLLCNYDL